MKNILLIITALAVLPVALSAKGECKGDREKFCSSAPKGDLKAMHLCMKSHDAELSDACKRHRDENRENHKDIRKACKKDAKKICGGVTPGEGRMIQCLKKNTTSISQACNDALANTNLEHN